MIARAADDGVPTIMHQTWKTADVPPAFRPFQRSWLRHNPDWEYRFWTDATARALVAQHYAWLLPLYDSYSHAIKRVDAFRYVLMHRFGGVYADLDFECLRPLAKLLTGHAVVLGLEPDEHLLPDWAVRWRLERIVGNAFIASTPGHPFWEFVLNRLEASHAGEPVAATGPFFLTHAVTDYAERERLAIVESDLLYPASKTSCWEAAGDTGRLCLPPQAFAVHHFWGTWCRPGALASADVSKGVP